MENPIYQTRVARGAALVGYPLHFPDGRKPVKQEKGTQRTGKSDQRKLEVFIHGQDRIGCRRKKPIASALFKTPTNCTLNSKKTNL
jgi:hypothetical protein